MEQNGEHELQIFNRYLSKKGLRATRQRKLILLTFLESDKHIDVRKLYSRIREKGSSIGYATVYRTMKLLTECGIAQAHHFGDGSARYEQGAGQNHHDHLICLNCGQIIEFENSEIEMLQDRVAGQHGFRILDHKLEIYGHCSQCREQVSS